MLEEMKAAVSGFVVYIGIGLRLNEGAQDIY